MARVRSIYATLRVKPGGFIRWVFPLNKAKILTWKPFSSYDILAENYYHWREAVFILKLQFVLPLVGLGLSLLAFAGCGTETSSGGGGDAAVRQDANRAEPSAELTASVASCQG
jgi:hypothetical protein